MQLGKQTQAETETSLSLLSLPEAKLGHVPRLVLNLHSQYVLNQTGPDKEGGQAENGAQGAPSLALGRSKGTAPLGPQQLTFG